MRFLSTSSVPPASRAPSADPGLWPSGAGKTMAGGAALEAASATSAPAKPAKPAAPRVRRQSLRGGEGTVD